MIVYLFSEVRCLLFCRSSHDSASVVGHFQNVLYHVFRVIVIRFFINLDNIVVTVLGGLLLVGVFEAFVPDSIERLDLLFAELHPLVELSTTGGLGHAHSRVSSSLLIRAFFLRRLFINLSLSNVTDTLSDLDNLSHVHTGSPVLGVGEVELGLAFKLDLHEALKGSEILLIVALTEASHNNDDLLVGDRTEGVSLKHVEHSVRHMSSQHSGEKGLAVVFNNLNLSSFLGIGSSVFGEVFVHG